MIPQTEPSLWINIILAFICIIWLPLSFSTFHQSVSFVDLPAIICRICYLGLITERFLSRLAWWLFSLSLKCCALIPPSVAAVVCIYCMDLIDNCEFMHHSICSTVRVTSIHLSRLCEPRGNIFAAYIMEIHSHY